MGFNGDRTAFLLRLLDAQVEVMILAGFFKGVDGRAAVDVFGHKAHAVAYGDFVIGEFAGCKGVLVGPGFASLIPFEVVAFEVALRASRVASEVDGDGGVKVLKVSGGIVDNFASVTANEDAQFPNVRKILIAGKVENA